MSSALVLFTRIFQSILNKHFKLITIVVAIVTAVGYGVCGLWIFKYLPDDYLQGDLVKIMYIHVPCAWISLASYIVLGILSTFFLVYNNKAANIAARATLVVSLHTSLITLVTGSIWGKAAWGTWWIWDPRLTATFIQFCILLVCLILHQERNNTLDQATAVLSIIGLINIPVIKFAVNAWNSIHQNASVLRGGGPKIHPDLLYPLFLAFFSISCFYILVGLIVARNELLVAKSISDQMRKK